MHFSGEPATGGTLVQGGYHMSRRPVSLARTALREASPIRELVVSGGGIETELIFQLPSVRRVLLGYASLGVWGLAPSVRRRIEQGEVEVVELGVTSVLRCLQAGGRLDPFAVTRAWQPSLGVPVKDGLPTTSTPHFLEPVRPDEVYLHVPYADPENHIAWGYGVGPDLIFAVAARRLIVSYDVSTANPPVLPNRFVLPGHLIASLEHRPFGAFPSACYPLYGPCAPFFPSYLNALGKRKSDVAGIISSLGDRSFMHEFVDAGARQKTLSFRRISDPIVTAHREELARWMESI